MIDFVEIKDKTHYVADTCNNGGDYSFSITYKQVADDKFEVIHSTSADFPYCPLCGNFYQGICACGMEDPDIVSYYGENGVHDAIFTAIERQGRGEAIELIIKRI